MEASGINHVGEFSDLINNIRDPFDKKTEESQSDLIASLNFALAEGWLNGKCALHVHMRVRLVGKSDAEDLCFVFQRKFPLSDTVINDLGICTPPDSFSDGIQAHKRDMGVQSAVFIHVGEMANYSGKRGVFRGTETRLSLLNDCPRIPIDCYPIKNSKLWLSLSGLDFIEKQFLAFTDRELIPPSWFMSISKDKLPDEMVKGTSEVMDNISGDNGEADIRPRERLNHYYIPGAITPYITMSDIGLFFTPDVPFRYESIMMFFGPAEFSSYASEVSNRGTHMLYYPHEGEKDAKDTEGARNSRTHEKRVLRQSKEGCQVNASQL